MVSHFTPKALVNFLLLVVVSIAYMLVSGEKFPYPQFKIIVPVLGFSYFFIRIGLNRSWIVLYTILGITLAQIQVISLARLGLITLILHFWKQKITLRQLLTIIFPSKVPNQEHLCE